MARSEASIDWRNVRYIVNQGMAALRDFLIGASYCLSAGSWKSKTGIDHFDFINMLGNDNLEIPIDLAGIRNSLEVMGICIHGARYFDSVIAEGFTPPTEKRRAGCKILMDAVEKYTIFEPDIFQSMYGNRESDPNGIGLKSFRGVLIDSYTRCKKALIAPTAEDREYIIREIPTFKSAGDVPVLIGFDQIPINNVPRWYSNLRASTGGRRWKPVVIQNQRQGHHHLQPQNQSPCPSSHRQGQGRDGLWGQPWMQRRRCMR